MSKVYLEGFIPIDGYYLVVPIKGSDWAPTACHIYNKRTTEDYIVLNERGSYNHSELLDYSPYFASVLKEGGRIISIPKEKFEVLVSLYK